MNITQTSTVEELIKQNILLQEQVKSLQGNNVIQQNQIKSLREDLDWFRRQMFGKRSEKIVGDLDVQPTYFPGLEEFFKKQNSEEKKKYKVPEHERTQRKKTGKDALIIPEGLPVERIELDIPEEEKICPNTNKPLVKIGEEVTRKLAHTPGSYFIKEYVRPKYAFPPESEEEGIKTAYMPDSILPKCQLDESFLAEIITRKFADHLPLYRVSEIFSRDGLQISRQYLSQIVVKVGQALKPLYDEMLKMVLKSGNIFVDETPIKVLLPGKGKAHQGYMWVIVGGKSSDPPYRVYDFHMNRKHQNIIDHLNEYKGNMHSDKYAAYEKLGNYEDINWCPCWAHIRRKFFEAESGCPEFRQYVLQKIRYLFLFERIAWSRSEEERIKIREEKEGPIIDELTEAIKDKLENGNILPKSKLSKAMGYYYGLIPYLKNYIKDPYARLDNNVAERAIRPLTIGRKNWLFAGSPRGGEAAAIILSLVQTCRGLHINPREYLEDICRRLMGYPANSLSDLLPDNWKKTRQ